MILFYIFLKYICLFISLLLAMYTYYFIFHVPFLLSVAIRVNYICTIIQLKGSSTNYIFNTENKDALLYRNYKVYKYTNFPQTLC